MKVYSGLEYKVRKFTRGVYQISGQEVIKKGIRIDNHKKGGQEDVDFHADITIGGGSRGGSKTFSLLLEVLKDYDNKNFRSIILRKEVDDLTDIVDTSNGIYGDFGTYNRSKADMTWNFHSGGALKFNYYSDSFEDFKIRYQGKQYAYIGIDEITHIEYLSLNI